MKVVFYSPYIPGHFGGGEKYLLDTACVYAQKHDVAIGIGGEKSADELVAIKRKYEKFLGQELQKIEFIAAPLGLPGKRLQKLAWTRKFDVLYYVTDGSAFVSLAGKNIMHIQVPLTLPPKKGWEKWKFKRFRVINANSLFTKKVVEKFWKVDVDLVCHPGVRIEDLQATVRKKEKIILSVGRFFDNLHTKNQDFLVETFGKLREKNPELLRGWKLVLIGSVESKAYLDRVRKLANGLPVEIITNAKRAELVTYYQKAAIYWHATGALTDEEAHPEKMEHFGIATVEAMAAGAIPIVVGKGGQKEILGNKLRDLSWQTQNECLKLTRKFIKDEKMRAKYEALVRVRAQKFGWGNFEKKCWQMLEM